MKILYIGVHSHEGWGAEYWMMQAFRDLYIDIELLDYRYERKTKTNQELHHLIINKSNKCDLIFLQRGDNLSPYIFNNIKIFIYYTFISRIKQRFTVKLRR